MDSLVCGKDGRLLTYSPSAPHPTSFPFLHMHRVCDAQTETIRRVMASLVSRKVSANSVLVFHVFRPDLLTYSPTLHLAHSPARLLTYSPIHLLTQHPTMYLSKLISPLRRCSPDTATTTDLLPSPQAP